MGSGREALRYNSSSEEELDSASESNGFVDEMVGIL